MPWKETCVMDQRIAFVSAALRDEAPMSELCAAFGISRNTGYKWLRRWRGEGPAGLEDRSRAPHCHGRQMAPELAEAILALRRARPHWGPRKLRVVLQTQQPEVNWPAASTIGDLLRRLLRRHGLSDRRRRRAAMVGPSYRLRPGHCPQRSLVHRLQGLVPHPRRPPLRPADHHRCLQPLRPGLPDRRAALPPGRGAGLEGLRAPWPAQGDPLRQRTALCRGGPRRADPAVPALAQGRHRPRADRARQAPYGEFLGRTGAMSASTEP